MALEQAGELFNIAKLKAKLKKRYPDHNFDVPQEPDRKCKVSYLCNNKDKIKYSDVEGNVYCGQRYKLTDKNNPYKWEWATCHALLETTDEQRKFKDLQEDIF